MSYSEYGGWSWRRIGAEWKKIARTDGHFQAIGNQDFFVVIGDPERVAIGAWKYAARVHLNGLPCSDNFLVYLPGNPSIQGELDGWQYAIATTRYPTDKPGQRKHQGTMFCLRSPEGVEEIGICGSCLGDIPNWRAWMIGTNRPHISERRALLKVTSWLAHLERSSQTEMHQ